MFVGGFVSCLSSFWLSGVYIRLKMPCYLMVYFSCNLSMFWFCCIQTPQDAMLVGDLLFILVFVLPVTSHCFCSIGPDSEDVAVCV